MKNFLIIFLIISKIITYPYQNFQGGTLKPRYTPRVMQSTDENFSCGINGWKCKINVPIKQNYYESYNNLFWRRRMTFIPRLINRLVNNGYM